MSKLSPIKSEKWHLFVSELVHRRAARLTLSDCARTTIVTSLQSQMNWQIFEERRHVARLRLFYKIVNGPCSFLTTHSPHIGSPAIASLIQTGKDYYKINTPSFHWLLHNGMPFQPIGCSCSKYLDLEGSSWTTATSQTLDSTLHVLF